MKKQNLILSAALVAVFSASTAFAEAEVTGKIVHESAKFTTSGTTIGAANAHGKDAFKQETSARIFIDGEADALQEGSTYHVEVQAFKDGKAGTNYDSNESYTQRDVLREAYVDAAANDWSIRAGKQQVVWGTADGMKLLDMINPSDYSEMAQNQMEDSRIPVWMVNAEKTNEDGSEFQVVVSEPKENVFAGLNRNINTSLRTNTNVTSLTTGSQNVTKVGQDAGHAFIMKGVDSITGSRNGFLNIVPDLGTVSTMFGMAFNTTNTSAVGLHAASHGAMNYFTVGSFNTSGATLGTFDGMYQGMIGVTSTAGATLNSLAWHSSVGETASTGSATTTHSFSDLIFGGTGFWMMGTGGTMTASADDATAGGYYTGQGALSGFAGLNPDTNLQNIDSATNSVFEYMDRTPFSTFDAFVGAGSKYRYKMPSSEDADIALRFKDSLANGMNYSLNFSNAYDKNPIINLGWEDRAGNKLQVCRNNIYNSSAAVINKRLSLEAAGAACTGVNVTGGFVANAAGQYPTGANSAVLVFEQEVKRVQNFGGSFDTAIESAALGPVVIRGEALYTKGAYSPTMDRGALSIGDLPAALTMRKGDRFKYVLGADITALTNMMVSAQFIQDRNLDYIDNNVDYDGSTCGAVSPVLGRVSPNCGVYTTDYATMHLTNGFNKATKDKNFYSLFLSKPFGASGEHRWNNIFMLEDTATSGGSGKWNRLDAEFSIDDDTQATVEYNKYWGNANTQFGQLEAASNIQVGVKYSF